MQKSTKNLSWISAAFLLLLQIPAYAKSSNPQAELAQAIEKFNQAFMQADIKVLDTLLTEEYLHTNSGSKAFNKASWLNWIKGRQASVKAGTLKYDSYRTEDLEMVFYQDAAVVTGRNIAQGKDADKPFSVDIRFTHLWVKQDGHWKRASFHDAPTK